MGQARAVDPFAVLGVAPRYAVSAAELEAAYFAQSQAWHPDKFVTAAVAERIIALDRSRAVNDAYKLLKSPVARAGVVLARFGVTIGDHERLAPDFLMEILELREALAHARAAGETATVLRMQADMTARRAREVAALETALAPIDSEAAAATASGLAALALAKNHLIVLRYLDRYLEECDIALDDA